MNRIRLPIGPTCLVLGGSLWLGCADADSARTSERAPVEVSATPPGSPAAPPAAEPPAASSQALPPAGVRADDRDIAQPVTELTPPVRVPGSAAALCAALGEDRSQANAFELQRLGLQLSSARVEGTIGEPIADATGFFAPFDLEKVWVGPSFLEGVRVYLDAAGLEGVELPGRYLLGFGGTTPVSTGSQFPHWFTESRLQWEPQVIVPVAERDQFADLLVYEVQATPLVAVVEVIDPEASPLPLRLIETLAGDIAPSVSAVWVSPRELGLPALGAGRYLASFTSATPNQRQPAYLVGLLDFRPYDAAARAAAEAAIESPPRLDVQGLRERAEALRAGWVFQRAPAVLATRISGIANECCSNAGGTFFAHQVVADFRHSGVERVTLGGLDYFSEEQCGDGAILALGGLEPELPAEPEAFACGARQTWPSRPNTRTAQVLARRPDSEPLREQVSAWLSSPEPTYLLRPPSDGNGPAELGSDAVWSQPLSVEEALAAAPLTWISVVDAQASAGNQRITLETTFAQDAFEHLPRQRFQIDSTCIDPRLLRVGATWLAPLVVDDVNLAVRSGGTERSAFLIPGVLVPNTVYAHMAATKLRSAVGAEALLE